MYPLAHQPVIFKTLEEGTKLMYLYWQHSLKRRVQVVKWSFKTA